MPGHEVVSELISEQVWICSLIKRSPSSEAPAKNEIFNVTNGDFFRWKQLWPKIAEFFDMPIAEPQTISLVNWMADKGPVWDAIVAKHRLHPHKLEQLAGWKFGDLVFGSDYDVMSDTTKIRQHGFHRVEASDIMMIRLLKEFREAAVIP